MLKKTFVLIFAAVLLLLMSQVAYGQITIDQLVIHNENNTTGHYLNSTDPLLVINSGGLYPYGSINVTGNTFSGIAAVIGSSTNVSTIRAAGVAANELAILLNVDGNGNTQFNFGGDMTLLSPTIEGSAISVTKGTVYAQKNLTIGSKTGVLGLNGGIRINEGGVVQVDGNLTIYNSGKTGIEIQDAGQLLVKGNFTFEQVEYNGVRNPIDVISGISVPAGKNNSVTIYGDVDIMSTAVKNGVIFGTNRLIVNVYGDLTINAGPAVKKGIYLSDHSQLFVIGDTIIGMEGTGIDTTYGLLIFGHWGNNTLKPTIPDDFVLPSEVVLPTEPGKVDIYLSGGAGAYGLKTTASEIWIYADLTISNSGPTTSHAFYSESDVGHFFGDTGFATSGANAHGIYGTLGTELNFHSYYTNISVSGNGSHGINLEGYRVSQEPDGNRPSRINAIHITVWNGGNGDGIRLNNSIITSTGEINIDARYATGLGAGTGRGRGISISNNSSITSVYMVINTNRNNGIESNDSSIDVSEFTETIGIGVGAYVVGGSFLIRKAAAITVNSAGLNEINNGGVSVSGTNAKFIIGENVDTIDNEINISVKGQGAYGLRVSDGAMLQHNPIKLIIVASGGPNGNIGVTGLSFENAASSTSQGDVSINVTGINAVGLSVVSSTYTTSGILVATPNNRPDSADLTIVTASSGAKGIYIGKAGTLTTNFNGQITVTTNGANSKGIELVGTGATLSYPINSGQTGREPRFNITTNGEKSVGLDVIGANQFQISGVTTININGIDSIGIRVSESTALFGTYSVIIIGSTVYGTEVKTLKNNSPAIEAYSSTLRFSSLSVATAGNDSPGAYVGYVGTIATGEPLNDSRLVFGSSGPVAINTSGERSIGLHIANTGLSSFSDKVDIITNGIDSHALLVDNNENNTTGSLSFAEVVKSTTKGNHAYGLNIRDKSIVSFSKEVNVNTSGMDAKGIYLKGANNTQFLGEVKVVTSGANSNGIDISDSQFGTSYKLTEAISVDTSGIGSNGIYISNSQNVIFNGAVIVDMKASSGSAGSIVIEKSTVELNDTFNSKQTAISRSIYANDSANITFGKAVTIEKNGTGTISGDASIYVKTNSTAVFNDNVSVNLPVANISKALIYLEDKSSLTVAGNLTITTSGMALGIEADNTANSIRVTGNTNISGVSGSAISIKGGTAVFGTTAGADNNIDLSTNTNTSSGAAIYVDNASLEMAKTTVKIGQGSNFTGLRAIDSTVTIGALEITTGGFGNAIELSGTTATFEGLVTLKTVGGIGLLIDEGSTANFSEYLDIEAATGIGVGNGSKATFDEGASIVATDVGLIVDLGSTANFGKYLDIEAVTGISIGNGSKVILNEGASIVASDVALIIGNKDAIEGLNNVTLVGRNYSIENLVGSSEVVELSFRGNSVIEGNMINIETAGDSGSMKINLYGNSTWQGGRNIDTGVNPGVLDLVLNDSSIWHVDGDYVLNSLVMKDNSMINFMHNTSDFREVKLNDMAGSGLIAINLNMAKATGTVDTLVITTEAGGDFKLQINNLTANGIELANSIRLVKLGASNNFSLSFENGEEEFIINGVAYKLVKYKNGTEWFLSNGKFDNPADVPYPDDVEISAIYTSALGLFNLTRAVDQLISDTLLTPKGNVFVTTSYVDQRYQYLNTNTGLNQQILNALIGAKIFNIGRVNIGLIVGYSNGKQEVGNELVEGRTNSFTLGITALYEINGLRLSAYVRGSYQLHSIDILTSTLDVKDNLTAYGVSGSVQVTKNFNIGKSLYIAPNARITLTNMMGYSQDFYQYELIGSAALSVMTGVGVKLGGSFMGNVVKINPYVEVAFAFDTNPNYTARVEGFSAKTVGIDGKQFEFGGGVDVIASDFVQIGFSYKCMITENLIQPVNLAISAVMTF